VQFLSLAAFANPSPTATGLATLEGSLFHLISLVEGTRLQICAGSFDITNTPNFSNASSTAPQSLNFMTPPPSLGLAAPATPH
jgi:hypothetical protein